jgi:hypothetical protein
MFASTTLAQGCVATFACWFLREIQNTYISFFLHSFPTFTNGESPSHKWRKVGNRFTIWITLNSGRLFVTWTTEKKKQQLNKHSLTFRAQGEKITATATTETNLHRNVRPNGMSHQNEARVCRKCFQELFLVFNLILQTENPCSILFWSSMSSVTNWSRRKKKKKRKLRKKKKEIDETV